MRHRFKIITASLFASCLNKSPIESIATPSNSKFITTALKDSLGKVSFSIPNRYDTSFTWTNHSDCGKPCDHIEYRFQPKSLPVFKESGFYYAIPDIYIDQFTILHSGSYPFSDRTDTSKYSLGHEPFKGRLSSDPSNGQIKFDTIERIGDRYYSIISLAGFNRETQRHFAKLAALTTVKGNEIEFHFDTNSKDTINEKEFFNNSTKFIRTIRISNGI